MAIYLVIAMWCAAAVIAVGELAGFFTFERNTRSALHMVEKRLAPTRKGSSLG